MSVDIKTVIAFGWKISYTEHHKMNIKSHYIYENEFIPINSYQDEEYIFGISLADIPTGKSLEFNLITLSENIPTDFISEYHTKLTHMERLDLIEQNPSIYIISQVT